MALDLSGCGNIDKRWDRDLKSRALGNYITGLRLSRGYSQLYLAQVLEIGRQAYSHYETGRNISHYPAIVKRLNCMGYLQSLSSTE